ncbi:hypothetical protein NEOLEDRAFT_1152837, partial [Neolentinus lepideus HHB14362 ss-1]
FAVSSRPAQSPGSAALLSAMSSSSNSDELFFSSPVSPARHHSSSFKRVSFTPGSPTLHDGRSYGSSHNMDSGARHAVKSVPASHRNMSSSSSIPRTSTFCDSLASSNSDDSLHSFQSSDAWRAVGGLLKLKLPYSCTTRSPLDPVREMEADSHRYGVGYCPNEQLDSRNAPDLGISALRTLHSSEDVQMEDDENLGIYNPPALSRSLQSSGDVPGRDEDMLDYDSSQSTHEDTGWSLGLQIQAEVGVDVDDTDQPGSHEWVAVTVDELLAQQSLEEQSAYAPQDVSMFRHDRVTTEEPWIDSGVATDDIFAYEQAFRGAIPTYVDDQLLPRSVDDRIGDPGYTAQALRSLVEKRNSDRDYAWPKRSLLMGNISPDGQIPSSRTPVTRDGRLTRLSFEAGLQDVDQSETTTVTAQAVLQRQKEALEVGDSELTPVIPGVFQGPCLFGDEWDNEEE